MLTVWQILVLSRGTPTGKPLPVYVSCRLALYDAVTARPLPDTKIRVCSLTNVSDISTNLYPNDASEKQISLCQRMSRYLCENVIP